MATESLGFTERAARDYQYEKWKQEGSKGLARTTDHQGNDPQIIWVVSRTEPPAIPAPEKTDGQNSVHDSKTESGPKADVPQRGSAPEGMPTGSDCHEFRDWSA